MFLIWLTEQGDFPFLVEQPATGYYGVLVLPKKGAQTIST